MGNAVVFVLQEVRELHSVVAGTPSRASDRLHPHEQTGLGGYSWTSLIYSYMYTQIRLVIGILSIPSRFHASMYNILQLQLGLGLALLGQCLLVAVVQVLPERLRSLRALELQSTQD